MGQGNVFREQEIKMKTVKTIVKTKSASKKAALPAVAPTVAKQDKVIHEDIRLKAYELYLERNGAAGNDTQDWLTAERMVLQKS